MWPFSTRRLLDPVRAAKLDYVMFWVGVLLFSSSLSVVVFAVVTGTGRAPTPAAASAHPLGVFVVVSQLSLCLIATRTLVRAAWAVSLLTAIAVMLTPLGAATPATWFARDVIGLVWTGLLVTGSSAASTRCQWALAGVVGLLLEAGYYWAASHEAAVTERGSVMSEIS